MGNPNDWQYLLPLILLKLAGAVLRYYWPVTLAVVLLLVMFIAACTTAHPSRQMNTMTADELRRELARPIP